jgi:pantetheine-phosphate adenylyltransferase
MRGVALVAERLRHDLLEALGGRAGVLDLVGVVRDPNHKQTLFTVEERVAFLEEAVSAHANVTVDVFHELVVDFARKHDAKTMVKGLRVIADFEWEFQMNRLNHLLAPEVETMYVMSSPEYAFVSSSGVKEIASFGGRVESLVTPAVAERFRELYPNGRPGPPLSPGTTMRQRGQTSAAHTQSGTTSTIRGMDVLVLIDKLDDLVHNAKAVPLTDQVRIDREEIYDILDQMRATIPEEIKQARWIVKERQEMLAEAKREAERVIKEAREEQIRLIGEEKELKDEVIRLSKEYGILTPYTAYLVEEPNLLPPSSPAVQQLGQRFFRLNEGAVKLAVRVSPKDVANDCQHFSIRTTIERETTAAVTEKSANPKEPSGAKKAFDDLFKF